jgi:hypothetical protein
VGAVVGLGEGKNVGVAVDGVAVVGAAVAITANQIDLRQCAQHAYGREYQA